MMLCITLVTFALLLIPSFSSATRILPRGQYADTASKAFQELRDVMVHPRSQYPVELPPRLYFPGKKPMPRASNPQDSAAAVKRTLLGKRQTCSAGYGYCYQSGVCCPDRDGTGGCCNDGTCIDSQTQTCCLYGGYCNDGTECCGTNKGCCDPGYFCCGNGGGGQCAPNGGECCRSGGVCPSGKHCVLYDNSPTCCTDLSCSEFAAGTSGQRSSSSGAGSGGDDPVPIAPPPPIPDTTIPSFTATFTSVASITSISIPTITAATTSSLGRTSLKTYTTTFTIYYYYIFVTTTTLLRTPSAFVTSDFTSTTTLLTVQATDSRDARRLFNTLSSSLRDAPTATVTASAASAFSRTYTSSTTSRGRSQFTGAVAGDGEGAFSGASRGLGRWKWGVWVCGVVGMGAAVGMVLL